MFVHDGCMNARRTFAGFRYIKQPPSYNRIDHLAVSKIVGQIIWLICVHVANDHMNICDIKYLPGNESERASTYVSTDNS